MDIAYLSAVSALAGSVIGSLTSTGMTWLTQLAQARSAKELTNSLGARNFIGTSSSRHPRHMAMHS